MADDKQKIYDRFSDDVQYMIIFAKAASINAKVDQIYPESFVIGLLTVGINAVTQTLVKHSIDLEKCLKDFKEKLSERKDKNTDGNLGNFDRIKPTKSVKDICQLAGSICDEWGQKNISSQHIFLAILRSCQPIKQKFIDCGLNIDTFTVDLRKVDSIPVKRDAHKDKVSHQAKHSALDAFCVDMTKSAEENQFDPIIARENEIEEAITILCRRNKSNPILVGEPGVGKSSIVEGICQRIISKTVPKKLRESKIYSLNIGMLVAGTKYRGEFENRLQAIIKELKDNTNYILFVDEIHNVVGAGSASGSVDAANMLKPALARGLKCIGATTNAEHKRIFSSDGALDRRFEKIVVDEPNEENTKRIIMGIKSRLEEYHKCVITEDAIDMAIKLAGRYKPEKHFPDKAIDCIDTACAKYAWKDEETAIIIGQDVAVVISKQCKIPLEIILWDNYARVQNTETVLRNNVIGQDHAISSICRVLKNSYSGVRNPNKPIGVFVIGGESGTGKTHTAKELAKALFDNESSFIRIDMTEYTESHSVSKITGSPPGYVGFKEADVISDKIKNRPYCVLLLDEIEKAHPNAIKMFLQVMAEGYFVDASGEKVNCKNIIMIMTGNFNMHSKKTASIGFGNNVVQSEIEKDKAKLVDYCKKAYGVEFVNRVDDFIPYCSIGKENLIKIAVLEIDKLIKRIDRKNCEVVFEEDVASHLAEISKQEHGINATIIGRLVSKYLEPCLADIFLSLENDNELYYTITVGVKENKIYARKKQKNIKQIG